MSFSNSTKAWLQRTKHYKVCANELLEFSYLQEILSLSIVVLRLARLGHYADKRLLAIKATGLCIARNPF